FHPFQSSRPARSYIRVKTENVGIDAQEYTRLVRSNDPGSIARAARFLKKGLLPHWASYNWVETARKHVAKLCFRAVDQLSVAQLKACRELPLLVSAFRAAVDQHFPKSPFPPPDEATEVLNTCASFLGKLLDARRFTLLLALARELRSA